MLTLTRIASAQSPPHAKQSLIGERWGGDDDDEEDDDEEEET
jgi:hypothetical protein